MVYVVQACSRLLFLFLQMMLSVLRERGVDLISAMTEMTSSINFHAKCSFPLPAMLDSQAEDEGQWLKTDSSIDWDSRRWLKARAHRVSRLAFSRSRCSDCYSTTTPSEPAMVLQCCGIMMQSLNGHQPDILLSLTCKSSIHHCMNLCISNSGMTFLH